MKKIFAWFKKLTQTYKEVESRKFGDKVHAYPNFATVTIVLAMITGVAYAICTIVEEDMVTTLSFIPFLLYIMVLQMTESVMVSDTTKTALRRFSLLLGFTLAAFTIGTVTSVVLAAILMILVVLLAIYFIIKVASGSLSASGSSYRKHNGSDSADEEGLTITDEYGYERKLKDVGFGRYQDDKGDYWKGDGWGYVSRE